MALNRFTGVFSETMFHPTVYDTGTGSSRPPIDEQKQFDYHKHALREDEEIIEFILMITTSGILEE